MMDLSLVHKFCENASLDEMRAKYEEVSELILQGRLDGTNADQVLAIIKRKIAKRELKLLFKKD
ncbi:MAG: hypothetical protein V2J55_04625 [Candidatus Competibacteraceae bacterium]|nr:hypothetical protein [Candidatus Competibacteraceae bacterium]